MAASRNDMDEQTIEGFEKRADETEARLERLEQRIHSSAGLHKCMLKPASREIWRVRINTSHVAGSGPSTSGQVDVAKLELIKQSLLKAKLEQADSVALCQKVCCCCCHTRIQVWVPTLRIAWCSNSVFTAWPIPPRDVTGKVSKCKQMHQHDVAFLAGGTGAAGHAEKE